MYGREEGKKEQEQLWKEYTHTQSSSCLLIKIDALGCKAIIIY